MHRNGGNALRGEGARHELGMADRAAEAEGSTSARKGAPFGEHLLGAGGGLEPLRQFRRVEAAAAPGDLGVVGHIADRPVGERAEEASLDALDQADVEHEVVGTQR